MSGHGGRRRRGAAPRLGILLLSGGHERAHYALVLATGAAALGREAVLEARGVAGIGTLLAAAAELGIRRIACEAGLRAEELAEAALAPGVGRAGVATFLSAVGDGQVVSL